MCHRAPVALLARIDQIAGVRASMRNEVALAYRGGADVAADVALVVSELATNAVEAGAQAATVAVDMHASDVTVSVSDDAAGTPRVMPVSTVAGSGRGLTIVAALASTWGVASAADGRGKTVWATLHTGSTAQAVFDCRTTPSG